MLYKLWALNAAEQDKLDMFGRRAQQIALHRQCPNVITNEELPTRTQIPPLLHIWSQQAIIYAGHIARMLHECLTRTVFFAKYDGAKCRGRRLTWRRTVDSLCSNLSTKQADNHQRWRRLAATTEPPGKKNRRK